ncbi:DUF3267 domain-containing protein [Paenibacillus radicis (ex Xue et al. 2023)]|uniref:DUF3267 domain-containing protein n=1 Tax=Paenibacillus radicis (ex Xue et al. 2023) TaxID=2972489 RepID=A0ABT1YCY0_9BACL|nr:DUF3267 domain-containing protein [Paenibacillus radicis (ex Xue et al. 2023)]MCR8630620.1 DUF3267 domain-containing protein [Paenibacillus radicis (ex Xue et al. 2023)]
MKITFHMPKADPDKQAKLLLQQWVKLKEPKSLPKAILLSVPFMILGGAVTIMITRIFSTVSLEDYGLQGGTITFTFNILYLVSIFLLLLLHELIHLILIPNFVKSASTGLGIQLFGGFVFSEEIISRLRFIIISLAPFLVISIILPIILGAIGWLNPGIVCLVFLNALGSSVDLLNVTLILYQVPKKAKIINNGMDTFWKVVDQ